MYWRYRYKNFERLCVSKSREILHHTNKSWSGIDLSKTEPEIVHEYLSSPTRGVNYLNQQIAAPLSTAGYEVKFASVFVHQKPRINRCSSCPPSEKSCELGDLLVIFSFLNASKTPLLNRAFLIQAKKDFKLDNKCQKAIYDEEVDFDFPNNLVSSSQCCKTSQRRYLPEQTNKRWQALKYLVFSDPGQATFIFTPWDNNISADWSIPILGLLTGFDGLRFSNRPYKGQGWSAIIWDLVTVTAKAITKGKKRGNYVKNLADEFNDFGNYHQYFRDSDEGPGIPTLLVFIRDRELFDKRKKALTS